MSRDQSPLQNFMDSYLDSPTVKSIPRIATKRSRDEDDSSPATTKSRKVRKSSGEDGALPKQEKRRLQNRMAAATSRAKRKAYITDLEEKVRELMEQNASLQKSLVTLADENKRLTATLAQHEPRTSPKVPDETPVRQAIPCAPLPTHLNPPVISLPFPSPSSTKPIPSSLPSLSVIVPVSQPQPQPLMATLPVTVRSTGDVLSLESAVGGSTFVSGPPATPGAPFSHGGFGYPGLDDLFPSDSRASQDDLILEVDFDPFDASSSSAFGPTDSDNPLDFFPTTPQASPATQNLVW